MPGCPGARGSSQCTGAGTGWAEHTGVETCTKACSWATAFSGSALEEERGSERSSGFLKATQQVKCSAWLRAQVFLTVDPPPGLAFLISWRFWSMWLNSGEMV